MARNLSETTGESVITNMSTTMNPVNNYTNTTPHSISETKTIHPRFGIGQIVQGLIAKCRLKMDSDPPSNIAGEYCNRTFDKWGGCWSDTPAGMTAQIPCLEIPTFDKRQFAFKECTNNGSWFLHNDTGTEWEDYSMCRYRHNTIIEEEAKHVYIFFGGFSISIVMLIISLAIFYRFKQLRCDRITIHKNLFVSYILTGVLWILYYALAVLDGDVLVNNPLWCRVLHVLCQYMMLCNYMWMFCEGLYLNVIMVYAFSSGKTIIISCYLIGWGVPVIFTSIYVGVRSEAVYETIDCWLDESNLLWINYGPIIFFIVVNALFLFNIVRLLVTKLRQMPEVTQTKKSMLPLIYHDGLCRNPFRSKSKSFSLWKATRATLILIPLLGLQFIILPIRPDPGSPLDDAYHIAVALLLSSQGAFVSIMYCFCNGEVLSVMTRRYTQHRLMRKRSSLKSMSGNIGTATTIDNIAVHLNNGEVTYKESSFDKLETEASPLTRQNGHSIKDGCDRQ